LLVFIAMCAVFWLLWLSYQYLPSDWLESGDVNRGSKNRNSLQIRVLEIEFSNSKLDINFYISAQAVTQAAGDRASRFCANGPAHSLDRGATAKARCRLETLAVRV